MANPLLEALAGRDPAAEVLVAPGEAWTAAAVLREMAMLAARLEGCRVLAVLADNSPAWVIADLAARAAGKVHLPLPAFFTAGQLHGALEQTAADALLTDQPERIGALDLDFGIVGEWQGLTLLRRVSAPAELPAGTAKVSFTSGSTGAPKGVCLSAAGLADTAAAVNRRLADLPLERHLAVLPLALLLENVAGVYACLLRGIPVFLSPLASLGWRGMAGFDPAALQAAVASAGASSAILVPELLKAWSLHLAASGRRGSPSLAYVAVGGARVDTRLLVASRGLGLPAYQGYGLTECGSVVSLNRPGDDGDGVGRALEHAGIRIADGEVVVKSRAFLGYAGSPAPQAAEFPTGDLGELAPDGRLHLSGRRKNLIITAFGRNIAPEWVESALLSQPAIAQGVVAGEARPFLTAVLVPMPGADGAALAAAVAAANRSLPDYARVRRWLQAEPFTPDNGLATGNGRPVRAAIHECYAAPLAAIYQEESSHAVP